MYESAPIERKDGSPVIGLALGSGAARGWAHLGVLRALGKLGVHVDVVSGCSIGALVGAALASGRSHELESWVRSLDWQDVVSMLDVSFRGGLIRGDRVVQYCAEHFFAPEFAGLKLPFACVATELHTGREVWLREGKVAEAVQSSIALPGLFSPVLRGGRVLVDGGLVNPVPVSLGRALGAEIVIAVELGSGVVGRSRKIREPAPADDEGWAQRILGAVGLTKGEREAARQETELPSLPDVVTTSINIMQMRIARSRLAGEPADVVISPRVAHLNMMEFDRAKEAIQEGEAAVERSSALIEQMLELR